jgi:hypothetical protein
MERLGNVSILIALFVLLTGARATAESDYKKICLVSQNLRVLDDSDDANSCRAIAVGSQAQAIKSDAVTAKTRALFLLLHPSAQLTKLPE